MTPESIRALMEKYIGNIDTQGNAEYLTALSALRGVYDFVDTIKLWEKSQSKSGELLFDEVCVTLEKEYDAISEKYHYKLDGSQ
ncbi:hypothetical protein AADZ84_11105 [Colwelliaceae bacterium MEBiC 14330]